MKEIKVTITENVFKRLRDDLVLAYISGRGLSSNEKAMGHLLDHITEGKTEIILEFKNKLKKGEK